MVTLSTSRYRTVLFVALAGALLAGCSGGDGATAHTPGPSDLGLSSGSHSTPTAHSSSGSKSATHSASRGASTTAAGRSSTAKAGGHSSSSSSKPGSHPTTTHRAGSTAPASNGCTSAAPPKSTDPSKAVITVCPGHDLHGGDTVTITGHSFKPNENLLAVECRDLGEGADSYGLSDCNISNLLNFKPAVQVKSNASGNVGPIQLTVATKFKSVDCTKDQCLVSVAVPIQKGDADNPHALIYFG